MKLAILSKRPMPDVLKNAQFPNYLEFKGTNNRLYAPGYIVIYTNDLFK